MSRTKLLTIAVLGLLLINLGTLIFIFTRQSHSQSQGEMRGEHNRGPRGEGPKQIIIERLGFDETQQKKYSILVDEHRKASRELHEMSRNLHDELYSVLKENKIDKTITDPIMNKISANQKTIDSLNFDHFNQIKTLCKPEQLEKFSGLVEDLTHLFSPHGPPPGQGPK